MRVEELIASVLPAVYLRAHCRGIGNVVNGDIVNWDKLGGRGCVLADGSSYFNRDPNDRPGHHVFVGYSGGRCALAPGRFGYSSRDVLDSFQNLCQATTRAGTDFMQQYFHTNTSTLTR